MILIIDNYDSFTYNLYQKIAPFCDEIRVVRNDSMTCDEIAQLRPKAIVLSPGPGRPEDAGICMEVIRRFASEIPILGICLGHQAIGAAFGGQVVGAGEIRHGKSSEIFHERGGVFQDVSSPMIAGRYHSLIIDRQTLPKELKVLAETSEGMIMAIEHESFPCVGLQFHPESLLTPLGDRLIERFLCYIK